MVAHSFLIDLAEKSLGLMVLVVAVSLIARRASAATRHLLWLLGFAGLLLLPATAAVLPAWRVLPQWQRGIVSESDASPVAEPIRNMPVARSLPEELPRRASSGEEAASTPIRHHRPIPWMAILLAAYSVGLGCFLLPVLAATLTLRRLKNRSQSLTTGPLWHTLQAAHGALGMERPVCLLVGNRQAMPMAWGIGRGAVLLPEQAEGWNSSRTRMVLLHEVAHLKRRDPLVQFVARLTCAVYWFNPLVWFALRQLRAQAELACDDLVLAADTKASHYAMELLEIATTLRAGPQAAAAIAMARGGKGDVAWRIRAILDGARNRKPLRGTILALTVSGIAAMVLGVACVRAKEAPHAPALQPVASVLDGPFPNEIHFRVGRRHFLPGDQITITSVHGTNSTLAPTNNYLIQGTYRLESRQSANIAAFVTSTEDNPSPIDPRQIIPIQKGSGTFSLILPIRVHGDPHVGFYPTDQGESFGGVYFTEVGQADAAKKAQTVKVVVSPTGIWFEGKLTTWEKLPELLKEVPDRQEKILAFALTSDQMTVRERNEALYRLDTLCHQLGFKYLSDTGIKPAPAETGAAGDSGEKAVTLSIRDGTITVQGDKAALATMKMQGNEATLTADRITLTAPREDRFDPSHFQPVVVKTVPESGATDVSSQVTELRVMYSKEMLPGSYSWCQFSAESFPKTTGSAHWVDGRTCVLPVKLEPHHHYVIGLNTPPYSNFQDSEHRVAVYYVLAFDTGE